MILTSKLLRTLPGIRHGFSTRLGGVSAGPYASLNLDRSVGDDERCVAENRARFAMMLGLSAETEIVQAKQVHGTTIIAHHEAKGASADGILATEAGVAVGIRTADCVPVLIAATDQKKKPQAVAAVHAGWRGATSRILASAVRALEANGSPRATLHFALGPAIGAADFEVGEEVVEAARSSLDGDDPPIVRGDNDRWRLDLYLLLEAQLQRLDIEPARIDRIGGSTYSAPALFFSHRRDRGLTGRHLSAIAFFSEAS